MSTFGAWFRSSIGTWVVLFMSVLVVTPTYRGLVQGENPDLVRASLISFGFLFLLIAILRFFAGLPLEAGEAALPSRVSIGSSATSFNVLDTSPSLRRTLRVLELERVTGFEFIDPIGKTNVLVHIPPHQTHASVMGRILPVLGEDPILTVSMVGQRPAYKTAEEGVVELLVLATFRLELTRAALKAASVESGSKIEEIKSKDARDLLKRATAAHQVYLAATRTTI